MNKHKFLGLTFVFNYDCFFLYFCPKDVEKWNSDYIQIFFVSFPRKKNIHRAKFQLIIWRKM